MHPKWFMFVCFLCFFGNAPTVLQSKSLFYLQKFGYIEKKSSDHSVDFLDERSYTKAIKDFQNFVGLQVTGIADDETLKAMDLPRCGVKDKIGTGERQKRYALQGSGWKVKDLTYKISKYPRELNKKDVDKEIYRAFSVWSDFTDLTFTPSKGKVHIEINFEIGEHGDGVPFDGPGVTLAHAYFPVFGGDAHFDNSEQWSINSYRGINLFQVAAHEFGHSLGLSHSDVTKALMAPLYRGYDPTFQLHIDDVQGIQALYGKKTKHTGPSIPDDDDDFDQLLPKSFNVRSFFNPLKQLQPSFELNNLNRDPYSGSVRGSSIFKIPLI